MFQCFSITTDYQAEVDKGMLSYTKKPVIKCFDFENTDQKHCLRQE